MPTHRTTRPEYMSCQIRGDARSVTRGVSARWHGSCVRTERSRRFVPQISRHRKEYFHYAIDDTARAYSCMSSDAMSAEQQILKMLPELQKEVLNHEVQEALKTHEEETQQQVRNIQEVFRQLGEMPEATTCYAVKGLARSKALLKEQPSPEILEMANLGGASKTEHYEMAMYTSFRWPRKIGETDAAQLLQDNLDQEKAMAVRVETLARSLASCRHNTP